MVSHAVVAAPVVCHFFYFNVNVFAFIIFVTAFVASAAVVASVDDVVAVAAVSVIVDVLVTVIAAVLVAHAVVANASVELFIGYNSLKVYLL